MKIYESKFFHPQEFQTEESLRERYKEFETYAFHHRYDVVGKLISNEGNVIRDIKLMECINKKYEYETYVNKNLYSTPIEETVTVRIYKGLKFKLKNNHVTEWFSEEELQRFNAPVPQQLDEDGYIVMVQDLKDHVIVNYGVDLIQQERKDVYCSVNGRYIKYKGKNFYIKEE